MITVRYPSGFSVQYNGGHYVKYYEAEADGKVQGIAEERGA